MRTPLLITVICLAFVSCAKDNKNSSSSNANIALNLKSSQIAAASIGTDISAQAAAESCTVTVETTQVSGTCYTPLQVSGAFNKGTLSSSEQGLAPIRLLGGGTEKGAASIFKHADFNLKTSPSITGEDTLENAAGKTYTFVALNTQYVEVAFQATPDSKIYHVRTFFVNNIPSSDTTLSASSCRVASALTEADSYGTLFEDISAQAGDIQVCVKTSATEACADSDFKWVDSSNALVSTRPTSPKQQSGTYLMTATSCPSDGANWGYGQLNIGLSTSVQASAEFKEGKKYYTVGGKTGTKLTFTMDISLTNALFVPSSTGITDLAAVNETAILANIQQILLKPMYVSKTRTGASAGDTNAMLTATPSLTVSD